jgi:hypothetical protein
MREPDKTFSLYGGKIIIDYWDDKHWYIRRDVGKILTSVTGATGIVSDANILMAWACKLTKNHLLEIIESGGMVLVDDIYTACQLFRAKRDEAGDIGTAVHDLIEKYIKSKLSKGKAIAIPKNADPRIINGFIAFKEWTEKNKVKFESSEQIVYSKKFDYVGTLDCRAIVNGKRTLIDFKTGNFLADTVPFQVSAYLEADYEESGREYEDRLVLHIKKDTGDFNAIHLGMEEHYEDYHAFVGLLTAKNRLKQKGGAKR